MITRLLPLLIAMAIFVGGATWYLNDSRDRHRATVLDGESAEEAGGPSDGGVLAVPDDLRDLAEARNAGGARQDATNGERTSAAGWIEGTVELPLGAPTADLGVWVLARKGRADADERARLERERPGDLVRVPVTNGRFRYRRGASEGVRLWLDSDWLYVDEAPWVEGDAAPTLKALLGGAIEIVARRPATAGADEELAGVEVRAEGILENAGMFGFGGTDRTVTLDADGRAMLRGLPTDRTWRLSATPEFWATRVVPGVEVVSGETTIESLDFRLGARLSGVVIDDRGKPVEGAEVRWQTSNRFMDFGNRRDAATTDEHGAYRLYGVRPGDGEVVAEKDGLLEGRVELEDLADAEERRGVDVTMSSGLAIAGVVRTKDGEPAGGATVTAARENEGGRRMGWRRGGGNDVREVEADEHGRFTIGGLVAGDYRVTTEWDAPGKGDWKDTQIAVPAGEHNLVITVAPPPGVVFLVTGPDGAPVDRVNIELAPVNDAAGGAGRFTRFLGGARPGSIDVQLESDDGRYVVEDVTRGPWTVDISGDGLVQETDDLEILVDGSTEHPVTLVRTASISGVVVDPSGAAVPDVNVRLLDAADDTTTPWGMRFGGDVMSRNSDDEGRFELKGLRPGSYELIANEDGYASSEVRGVDVRSGDEIAGIRLALRVGGTILGTIHGDDGRPQSGRTIMAMSQGGAGGFPTNATSDEHGVFEMTALEPGTYQVFAQPDMRRMAAAADSEGEPSPAEFFKSMQMTMATVVDGEVTEVALGAPPAEPVRVHGRVTQGGEPVDGGMVTFLREGGNVMDSFSPADVAKDGTYELVIDGGGRATAIYAREGFGRTGTEFPVVIPQRSEYRLDLELPGGAIVGRLLGTDGGPLPDQVVSLERRSGLPALTGMGMGNMTETDADGRFLFEDLEDGTYDLRAGGAGFFSGSAETAATVVSGVEVREGKPAPDVTIRLEEPGEVTGRVVDAGGRPAAGVTLFVRDEDGVLLARVSAVDTDANGRFVYRGLPAGNVLVEARGDAGSAAPVAVRVRSGGTTEVELRLSSSTLLRVRGVDAAGEPTRLRLSVLDAAGREMAGLRALSGFQRRMAQGFDTATREVGPLPPGTYTVIGVNDAGDEVRREVELNGAPERDVDLVFDGE